MIMIRRTPQLPQQLASTGLRRALPPTVPRPEISYVIGPGSLQPKKGRFSPMHVTNAAQSRKSASPLSWNLSQKIREMGWQSTPPPRHRRRRRCTIHQCYGFRMTFLAISVYRRPCYLPLPLPRQPPPPPPYPFIPLIPKR